MSIESKTKPKIESIHSKHSDTSDHSNDGFIKLELKFPDNLFDPLFKAQAFEDFSQGRKLAVVAAITKSHGGDGEDEPTIPIVRTTTIYTRPTQPFSPLHTQLIEAIRTEFDISSRKVGNTSGASSTETKSDHPDSIDDFDLSAFAFNNAMVEVYDSRYTKMGFHSDQALDLPDHSWICLFTAYEKGEDETHPRLLIVKDKVSGKVSEIVLTHHSAVLFSTETNKRYLHKIIADPHQLRGKSTPGRWLGVTLRQSKTFVKRERDGTLTFIQHESSVTPSANLPARMDVADSTDLTNRSTPVTHSIPSTTLKPVRLMSLATVEQKLQFLRYKGSENKQVGFDYPDIDYTLSCH